MDSQSPRELPETEPSVDVCGPNNPIALGGIYWSRHC